MLALALALELPQSHFWLLGKIYRFTFRNCHLVSSIQYANIGLLYF